MSFYTPRYLMRRGAVLAWLAQRGPSRLLDVGCGHGALLSALAQRGWRGAGLEVSERAAEQARRVLAPWGDAFRIVEAPEALDGERFPLVTALEVLEHIEHDEQALRSWRPLLAPGGELLVSVPAHRRHWTAADERVGHFRRYEAQDLRGLLERAGFLVTGLWSYGFPVTSVTVRLRRIGEHFRAEPAGSRQERTEASSFESVVSGGPPSRLDRALTDGASWLLHGLQRPFVHLDRGDGYLASAQLDPAREECTGGASSGAA